MNRDPKRHKGPYKDPVPLIGTHLETVVKRVTLIKLILHNQHS